MAQGIFARLLPVPITTLTASAEATAVAGATSPECTATTDGCAFLPITFPVEVFQCDSGGNLILGTWIGAPPPDHATDPYWPIVGEEDLPDDREPERQHGDWR